ncbi:DUF4365 domain-containing protein [Formosa sp. A9]|uniref:DUF4365 domain-containing protein n=1 Tax=Formosa sp. A9 TaxID=3442641 RepID=UPI003EB7619B
MTFNKEERIGVFSVAKIFVEDFEWIFREQPINDFGIDAFVEITKKRYLNGDIFPTGRIIGIQIKSGESFFNEENKENYVFRGSKKHSDYWLSHSIPIIIVIYNKFTNRAYWQEINKSTVILTKKAFKLNIPKINLLNTEAEGRLKRIGYFKNKYEYKLWQLRSASELIKSVIRQKHFLYIELSECHWVDNYQVSVLITQVDDENIAKVYHCSFQCYYSFYLPVTKSIVEGIKDIIPWVNLICNDIPFTDEFFLENVIADRKEFMKVLGINKGLLDETLIYSMACQMTGEYYFKLEVSPNELAFNFLALNEFLNKEPKVEQRLFL